MLDVPNEVSAPAESTRDKRSTIESVAIALVFSDGSPGNSMGTPCRIAPVITTMHAPRTNDRIANLLIISSQLYFTAKPTPNGAMIPVYGGAINGLGPFSGIRGR